MSDDDAPMPPEQLAVFAARTRLAAKAAVRHEEETTSLVPVYDSWTATPDGRAQLRRVLLAEYRCREGCLLLRVWRMPSGRCWYRPGFDLSPEAADDFPGPMRHRYATDGFRRWKAAAGLLDWRLDYLKAQDEEFNLACDHWRGSIAPDQLNSDTSGTPGPRRPIMLVPDQDMS